MQVLPFFQCILNDVKMFCNWKPLKTYKSVIDFTNILRKAFTRADFKSAKKYSQVFFALLGSACVKALSKMLVKLTPGLRFTKLLRQIHKIFHNFGL